MVARCLQIKFTKGTPKVTLISAKIAATLGAASFSAIVDMASK
jgi:hypothetical protein